MSGHSLILPWVLRQNFSGGRLKPYLDTKQYKMSLGQFGYKIEKLHPISPLPYILTFTITKMTGTGLLNLMSMKL